jgi:hypothetical protein
MYPSGDARADGGTVRVPLPEDPVDRIAAEAFRETVGDWVPWEGRFLQVDGTTRETTWLVSQGHEVVRLVETADAAAEVRDALVDAGIAASASVEVGERSSVPFADDSLDGACWLGDGPSRLERQSDRIAVVEELDRVVATDGVVVVAGVGLLGTLRAELAASPDDVAGSLERLVRDGTVTPGEVGVDDDATGDDDGLAPTHDATGAPDRGDLPTPPYHGFRLEEFERELVEAGLVVDTVAGLDGFLAGLGDALDDLDDDQLAWIASGLKRVHGERAVADAAARLLAVCRVQADVVHPAG